MGWFWGSSKVKDAEGTSSPLESLDPTLRDFLDQESPVNYSSSISTASPEPSKKYTDQLPPAFEPTKLSSTGVPPQSLFPDGRYAHIWKTYTPLAQVEAATKSDQEKLLDIIDGYKERKAQIGRAALENCSMEHMAVSDCFRYGGWKSRMTMCRAENKQFEKCYMMQARFLKALGYLSTYDRPPEMDEQIQMHADKLYHRMLDQEAAVEKAEAEGGPIPDFEPVIPTTNSEGQPSPSMGSDPQLPPVPTTTTTPANLKLSAQAQIEKRLKGLSPEQRAMEEKAIAAEIAVGQQVASQLDDQRREQDKARLRRREKGQETFSDRVTRWFRL